jgi:alkanesulfonate monooxygenase SsuD/methylene tetrahydromethanopterin reductase-like flavin-dependent oxidoreductase (luciferase family)
MKQLTIGLIDFGVRESHLNSLEIISDLLEYAQHADQLGFSRLWLPEHHTAVRKQPWTDPTTLLGLLVASTDTLRVGAAGVLLGIHQPYHVAGTYKLLNNLFSNRIDLGVANGRLSPELVELINGPGGADIGELFAANMRKLVACYDNEEQLLKTGTVLPPYKGSRPSLWSLSTNLGNSVKQALEFKTNLARSIFHKGADRGFYKDTLAAFRHDFQARHHEEPEIALVLSGAVRDTAHEVQQAVDSSPNAASWNLVGSPAQFYDTIMLYREEYGIDEFVINDMALSSSDRLHSLELWSEMFNLTQVESS